MRILRVPTLRSLATSLVGAVSLLAPAASHALPSFSDQGFVLTPTAGTLTQYGIGAPTVDLDGTGQYRMYFEAKLNTQPADCVSAYEIGTATSPDGLHWTVAPTPVIAPNAANGAALDHCTVSQPAAVYDREQGLWHLLYAVSGAKASPAETGNTDWGIAYATSTDGVTFTTVNLPAIPKITTRIAPTMPSVVLDRGTLTVVYVDNPNLKLATLSGGVWTVRTTPVVDKTKLNWTSVWAFSPALVCDDVADGHGWPNTWGARFEMMFGGDGANNVRRLALAHTNDVTSWLVGANFLTTSIPGTVNHWDLQRAGGDYLMWYSKDFTAGVKGIGLALADVDGDLQWSTPDPRDCASN